MTHVFLLKKLSEQLPFEKAMVIGRTSEVDKNEK